MKMSFDKYVHHISQKYRLAVAISVIKTKPENLSIDEYLIQLQNKIRNIETDPNETVCSDDFNFDEDGVWNEKENTEMSSKGDMINENRLECSVNENDSQGSQKILNDLVFDNEPDPYRENSLGDTIRLLKEVSTNVQEQPDGDINLSRSTFCESQEVNKNNFNNNPNKMVDVNPKNITENINMDSQETQLYTLHGFTQDYSHVSQTQGEYLVVSHKYIRNNDNGNIQDNIQEVNGQINDIQSFNVSQNATQNVITNNVQEREISKVIYEPPKEKAVNSFKNTQADQLQSVNFEILNKPAAVSKCNILGNVTKNVVKEREHENTDNILTNQMDTDNESTKNTFTQSINKTLLIEGNKNINGNRIETFISANDTNASTPDLVFGSENTVLNEFTVNDKTQCVEQDKIKGSRQTFKDKETQNNNANQKENNIIEMDVDETGSDENVQERVPFKVIEELNRVKTFLNRKDKKYDGYSTDSGYRSDSQHRALLSCSQVSEGWLNQSAHCLFNHILQALPTDEIVKEIAQVIGKLIDKLHEDENYPPFLEELLETVDSMLRDIHTGDGWADHLLLTKDEKIQRLNLLNKSRHILKYSIEKITVILEQLHTNLTQENLYECSNIVDLENICYIFNILEIFLKRYKKVKDTNQSTQNSQEDLPKRSSLTELWRKKWNPNCKEIVKIDTKICVLKICCEILNKIIVECMNGYSLVAFAALHCFNLIQD